MTSTTALAPPASGQQARQSLRVLAGSALGVLPLLQLLTDTNWLVQAWICMAIVITPAALLRLRWKANIAQLLPGLVLVTFYMTRVYVPQHTWGWLFPTRGSWADISALSTQLGNTVTDSVAPLTSTPAIRLFLSLGLVLFAVLADVITIEFRRPALAGVPFLLIFTLAGAVPRQAVSWLWFCLAAAGYLLILSSGSTDDMLGWGRLVAREGRSPSSRLGSALSGRRIGLTAIVVAVLVPFLLPSGSVNLVANALHNGHPGVGGDGSGSGGVTIDPLASLHGQLTRGSPINLFTVKVSGPGSSSAFYLRTTVLTRYNGAAWIPGSAAQTQAVASSGYNVEPKVLGPTVNTDKFDATITVQKLAGTPPLFAAPTDVNAVSSSWKWTPRTGLLAGNVHAGQQYTEQVVQPSPSLEQLETAGASLTGGSSADADELAQDTLASNVPTPVSDLVTELTAGKTTPIDRAEALLDYFRDPANGFVYSLQTKTGESGNDLVDFLTTGRAGFCQQYAAAMGVMLRLANIPSRVVLGYTHAKPNASGQFEVTTDDAHAWVEAYFAGIGWVPFDPTPLTGADAARDVPLPWNPAAGAGGVETTAVAHPASVSATAGNTATAAPAAKKATGPSDDTPIRVASIGGAFIVLLAALAATPWLLRVRRRRRRLHQAKTMGPEPLWDELADTARDVGLGWSPARTTRQVAAWLGELIDVDPAHSPTQDARAALHRIAGLVERERYAAGTVTDATFAIDDLMLVRTALLRTAPRHAGLRARLLPASLRSRARHAGAPAQRGPRASEDKVGASPR
jgi:transglutaminase-like putative cysteine protease